MKNILYFLLFISSVGYSQTPITDANFNAAIADCLSTHPVTGLCVDSEYGPMPDWDVSNVTDMDSTFYNRTDFNAEISDWDVSNVTNMQGTFLKAESFNQPIGEWDVSNVTIMGDMFNEATSFNQNIGGWDVSNVTSMAAMFNGSGLNTCNYDNTLQGWSKLDLTPNVTLSASGITYCDSETERQSIIDNFGWTINGDELNCTDVCIPTAIVTITDVMNITPRATAPSFPSKGDIYMNSTTNKLMVYDGTSWQACW